MRLFLLPFFILITSIAANAQFTLYKEVSGVQFHTKWGHEKWWSKKSPKVLLVKIKNTNQLAVKFELGVEFFKDLRMVEQSKAEEYCLSQFVTARPRSRGLVFKPIEVDPNTLDSFELTGLEIEKLPDYDCPKE